LEHFEQELKSSLVKAQQQKLEIEKLKAQALLNEQMVSYSTHINLTCSDKSQREGEAR
jgi:hypothetical protein